MIISQFDIPSECVSIIYNYYDYTMTIPLYTIVGMHIQVVKALRSRQCAGWDWRIVLGGRKKKDRTP